MNVWYMNGAGNDFMVMDARGQQMDFSPSAVELCKLTGADGFLALDHSDSADFRLHFYNSDGSRGEMCGNGCRCICRFAYDHGIVGESMAIETDAGIVYGKRLSKDRYLAKLNNPGIVDLNRKGGVSYVELGCPGIPHAVMEVPGLGWEMADSLLDQAKSLRFDPAFPKGVNVNLYTWLDENTIRILTYERFVEDYTLACGTGSASTAVVLWLKGELPSGKLTVKNKGGDLAVTLEGQAHQISALWLEGPAVVVKEYEI